jgi:hypothetical protein
MTVLSRCLRQSECQRGWTPQKPSFRLWLAPVATRPWPHQWVPPSDKLMSTNRPSYRPRWAYAISAQLFRRVVHWGSGI